MKKTIIIPARINSSRLPKKILMDLDGKPVIQRVYEQAIKTNADNVYIAVDDEETLSVVKEFTPNVVMTSTDHESGTDRIQEVATQIETDFIVNIQGDEPFINPSLIDEIFEELENHQMVTVKERIKTTEDLKNPNIVKVIVNHNNEAVYFSRSIIPHHRDEWETLLNKHSIIPNTFNFYRHVGVYGYTKSFLNIFANLPKSYLERVEKLEQLRVIENKYSIKMIETTYESIGIDTIEDYNKAVKYIKNK